MHCRAASGLTATSLSTSLVHPSSLARASRHWYVIVHIKSLVFVLESRRCHAPVRVNSQAHDTIVANSRFFGGDVTQVSPCCDLPTAFVDRDCAVWHRSRSPR